MTTPPATDPALTTCPVCGEPTPSGANWCEACGADLDPTSGPNDAATRPSAASPASRRPAANQAGGGAPPTDGPPCTACGERTVTADGYCGTCGHKQPALRDHIEMEEPGVVAITDKGIRHRDNEDAVAIAALGDGAIVVVCDGVSSTPDSAQASQLAVDAALAVLVERLSTAPGQAGAGEVRVDDALVAAAAAAQAQAASVVAAPTSDPHKQGGPPSSTFVAVVARHHHGRTEIDVAWIGDSRAYWIGPDEAVMLTDDHELGGSLTRWLGSDSLEPTPELTHLSTAEPGRLLVCSDGLWRYADPSAQLKALVDQLEVEHTTAIELAGALVDHALAGGGHDNITVALWNSV